MKKIVLLIIVIFSINSCATINLHEIVPIGKFKIKDGSYYEELELKSNGTFNLRIQLAHNIDNCHGEWKVKSKNELILNGLDTRKFSGVDSLFFKKLNCKNLHIKFKTRNKVKRKSYYLKRTDK